MRFALVLVLMLAATPAMAACPQVATGEWGEETAAKARQALCLQAEINARVLAEQRAAQLEADYKLRLQLLELQQRFARSSDFVLPLPSLPPF